MKTVQSSDVCVCLCGLSNWRDCLIPLPLHAPLPPTPRLKACQAHNQQGKKQRAGMEVEEQEGETLEVQRWCLGRTGGSLRPPPEDTRRQAEEGRRCGGGSVRVPQLISLSNIRYRPQTHTDITRAGALLPTSHTVSSICACRWPRLRSLVQQGSSPPGWFACSERCSAVSHPHWSEYKTSCFPHSPPNYFSTTWVRTFSAQPTFEPVSFLISLTADALHLIASPTL